MELYFKSKFYGGLTFICLIILLIIVVILYTVIKCRIWINKTDYLESIGFERKLWRVSSTGNSDVYRYVRKEDDIRIEEDEIERMSLRELKRKYKQL